MGNRVFGCDDCLAVCPWNRFAAATREMDYAARRETDNPPLAELLSLDDAAFRKRFAGTPIKRTGRDRVVRNALIAAGNSGDASLLPPIMRLLDDASALVRGMAVWALAQLVRDDGLASLAAERIPREQNDAVRREWRMALDESA
jgi:epoxyqueuosine reductase